MSNEPEIIEHKHLIIRTEVKNPPHDPEWTKAWLRDIVSKIGMKVCAGPISEHVDVIGNVGVTAVVIIETSHIAIHVWSEPDPALIQMDVYSCKSFDTKIIFDELKQFSPVKIEYKFLDRENGLVEIELDS